MSKTTLNLTVDQETKTRAKKYAKATGKSISAMVEQFLNHATGESEDDFTPTPGSGVEQLMNAIPESKKVKNPNYDKLKYEALKEKYDLE